MLTHTATPLNSNKNYIYKTHTHKTDCSEVPQSCVYDEKLSKQASNSCILYISVIRPPPLFFFFEMVLHLAAKKLESLVQKSTGVPRVIKVSGRTACSIPSQWFTQHRSGQQSGVLVVLYFAFHCIWTERNRTEKKKVPQKQNSLCIQLFPRSTEQCPASL